MTDRVRGIELLNLRLSFLDCFRVLSKSHVLYFVSFAGISCLQLGGVSPGMLDSNFTGSEAFFGVPQIFTAVQMFVLGPRLILSVREYHAKLVAGSDAKTSMASIVFQEHVHVTTSSSRGNVCRVFRMPDQREHLSGRDHPEWGMKGGSTWRLLVKMIMIARRSSDDRTHVSVFITDTNQRVAEIVIDDNHLHLYWQAQINDTEDDGFNKRLTVGVHV
ncbi:hypothetical protein EDB19DRAFT_1832796 [Suillus lakei]|nr:hypothetical protein EDB19DRAFT_1832796 [Suillus lakei]